MSARILSISGIIALFMLVSGCGDTVFQNGNETSTPGPDVSNPLQPDLTSTPGVDSFSPPTKGFCSVWDEDRTERNIRDLFRFGFSRSATIIEGSFGKQQIINQQRYAAFTVKRVIYGWSFLVGVTALVPVSEHVVNSPSLSGDWILGLSSSHPHDWQHSELPYWGNALVYLPASQRADYLKQLDYRAEDTPLVAVVKIIDQDSERTQFEVVEVLRGDFPVKRFSDNWYERWGLPYPTPSSSEIHPEISKLQYFIASLRGLTSYPSSGVTLGSIIDFRPQTPDELKRIKQLLADETPYIDNDGLTAFRTDYHDGYQFHLSKRVLHSEVSGLADECCTGAGGTYILYRIQESLRGESSDTHFVFGGHAYYGHEKCGDNHLFGLSGLVDPGDHSDYSCSGYASRGEYLPGSPFRVRLPYSAVNLSKVKLWIKSSAPLYKLYPADATIDPGTLIVDPANAPWSQPLDLLKAYTVATHQVLFTVEKVVEHHDPDWVEVSLTTTFARAEYEHLERYSLKFAFPCGDQTLMTPGARFVAAFVQKPYFTYQPSEEPKFDEAFMVPGSLLPEWTLTHQLAHELTRIVRKQ